MTQPLNMADPGAEAPAPFRPSWRVKLLFAVVALVFALIFSEILVRIAAPQPASWLDIYVRHPVLETYAIQPNAHRVVESGETRWEVDTDEAGFRVIKLGPVDRKGTLVLGDSFTFGNGVNAKDSFVGLLNENRVMGSTYLNAGVPGYGPIQYRQVLEYYLTNGFTPPRVLLMTYVGNDFHDCVWKAETRVVDGIIGNRGDLRSFIKRNSHAYRLVSAAYHRISPKPNDAFAFREKMFEEKNWGSGVLKEGEARMRTEFAAIAKLCADHSVPLLVVIVPIRDAAEPGGKPVPERDPNLPVTKVKSILSELGIRGLDLTPSLSGRAVNEVFFAHDGHLTPVGNKLAFEAIRAELSRDGR